jgi:formylglycine-generating enzyme required for sulfatase activity
VGGGIDSFSLSVPRDVLSDSKERRVFMRISPRFLNVVALSTFLVFWIASKASADVFNMPSGQTSVQFVTVGDPGNAPDTTGFGAVSYTYQMGEFDVTAAQYTQFLNAVAKTDPYRLFNASMSPAGGYGTPGIVQSGTSGNFTYSVAASNANFPVDEVSWGDAARFCNWLANGQPTTGVENASTTENGSYALNGAVISGQLAAVTRAPFATYVIPTENEWYKAAYYKGGSTNAGYWLYPTQSNSTPSNVLSMTGSNNANFVDPILGATDPATGVTSVGTFADSPSSYGTFDQGGDVNQWLQPNLVGSAFFVRGGDFAGDYSLLQSDSRVGVDPTAGAVNIGFRIAEVPEPSSISMLAIALFALLRRRNHDHRSNLSVR